MSAATSFSQVDTLQWGQREPTYYYWDNHWADCYGNAEGWVFKYDASVIIARYCYIDTSLRVIGVAGIPSKEIPSAAAPEHYRYTADSMRLPEYFQLYETSDSAEMILLAEARWDTNKPRYRMRFPRMYDEIVGGFWDLRPYNRTPYVYEAYFDSAITVHDSFFVAGTTYNNDWFFNDSTGHYEYGYYYPAVYYGVSTSEYQYAFDRIKIKFTNPLDRDTNPDIYVQDIQRDYNLGWYDLGDYHREGEDFICLFPIFDTTGLDIHGFRWIGQCDTVRKLRLLYIENGKAYITWHSTAYSLWWEVAYGPEGSAPEDCARDTSHSSIFCMEHLRPGERYVVYVRERCQDDTRGPWGDYITLTMPESNVSIQPEQTDVDLHTHIMPNPTDGITTVISGFKMSSIEVYNTAGALVESVKVNANTGMVDLSKLPSGTYILRINTNHGDTAKRVVKL